MEFEKFKSGQWRQRYQYKSFEPVPVNHLWTWQDTTIHQLLESANHALGILVETTGQQRGRIFSFDKYLRLFMD
jgi:hypothetical protein